MEHIMQSNSQQFHRVNNELILAWISKKTFKKEVDKIREKKLCSYFSSLKFKNNIYYPTDIIKIEAPRPHNFYICKILSILELNDNNLHLPLLQIQWIIKNQQMKWHPEISQVLGKQEVFFTNCLDYILVNRIIEKCEIVSLEEYENKAFQKNIFYCRALYDFKSNELRPSFSDWPKICICQKPANPDLQYVQCEKCQSWIHLQCSSFREISIDKIKSRKFKCQNCMQIIIID